jgi:hypothetical protein
MPGMEVDLNTAEGQDIMHRFAEAAVAQGYEGIMIKDPNGKDDRDKRQAFRFDLEYKLGAHNLRAGIDNQNFQSYAAGTAYYAGAYFRYYARPSNGIVNGATLPASATGYVRERVYSTTSGNFEVNNKATYVEDSWNVTKNVLLYAGLRSESFQNLNAEGKEFVAANNLLAPRLGASWDVQGDSSLKVYSNWGRYYIPVASNTNIRASGAEYYATKYYSYTGQDPRTLAPTGLTQLGSTLITSDGAAPDFARRIGIASNSKTTKYRHGPVDLGFHDHPLARGFAPSHYTRANFIDETYWALVGDPADVQLLASAEEDGALRPQLWTRQVGAGRVFVALPGHYNWTFDDPVFRLLAFRGITWAACQPEARLDELAAIGARLSDAP